VAALDAWNRMPKQQASVRVTEQSLERAIRVVNG
jgi:hypothetical protein